MNTNEIKAVIDMVSDKIAGGVQSVQPLAEEVVRQYAAKQGVLAIGSAVAAVVFTAISVAGAVLAYKAVSIELNVWNEESWFVRLILGGLATALGGLLAYESAASAVCHYGNMIAPLIGLMGK